MYWGGPRALWVVVSAVATNMVTQAVFAVISRRMLPALSFSWRLANLKGAREVTSFGTWMVMRPDWLHDLCRLGYYRAQKVCHGS
jgi:hypothetical protein